MRKVGVEIEYVGSIQPVTDGLRNAGLGQLHGTHSYIGHDNRYWVSKTDASVSNGGELVSPPLDFDNPAERAQITQAVEILQSTGAYPDNTTGIHVHVDCTDLTLKQVVAVVKNFYKYEDIIYRLASSGHERIRSGANMYAPPISEAKVRALIAAGNDRQALMRAWAGNDWYNPRSHGDASRYCGINLHSYFYRGTIEFRVFNGSVNPERVQMYVAMCVALVQDARNGKSRSINKAYRLGGMLAGSSTPASIFHRFQQVLRYEAGLSKDDMSLMTKMWNDSRPQAAMRVTR